MVRFPSPKATCFAPIALRKRFRPWLVKPLAAQPAEPAAGRRGLRGRVSSASGKIQHLAIHTLEVIGQNLARVRFAEAASPQGGGESTRLHKLRQFGDNDTSASRKVNLKRAAASTTFQVSQSCFSYITGRAAGLLHA